MKREQLLPFSRPEVGDAEIAAVSEVMRSGWLTTGPKTAQFEKALADYCGSKYALTFTSATTALHLLLISLGIGHGDEVVIPSLTFVCDANIIELLGAKPVFCDNGHSGQQ